MFWAMILPILRSTDYLQLVV